MLNKIKALADEAIKLQNKNRMDEVLREISVMCDPDLAEYGAQHAVEDILVNKESEGEIDLTALEVSALIDAHTQKPKKGAKNGK